MTFEFANSEFASSFRLLPEGRSARAGTDVWFVVARTPTVWLRLRKVIIIFRLPDFVNPKTRPAANGSKGERHCEAVGLLAGMSHRGDAPYLMRPGAASGATPHLSRTPFIPVIPFMHRKYSDALTTQRKQAFRKEDFSTESVDYFIHKTQIWKIFNFNVSDLRRSLNKKKKISPTNNTRHIIKTYSYSSGSVSNAISIFFNGRSIVHHHNKYINHKLFSFYCIKYELVLYFYGLLVNSPALVIYSALRAIVVITSRQWGKRVISKLFSSFFGNSIRFEHQVQIV